MFDGYNRVGGRPEKKKGDGLRHHLDVSVSYDTSPVLHPLCYIGFLAEIALLFIVFHRACIVV